MLIIRQSQLDTFQEEKDRQLIPAIIAFLEKNHAESAARHSSEELNELCAKAIEDSRFYGLTDIHSLMWFSAMAVEIGPQFHEQPAINRGLSDTGQPPAKRIEAMFAGTTEKDWEDARKLKAAAPEDK
jgi:hypothetical protein